MVIKEREADLSARASWLLWLSILVTIPVTSFPLVAGLSGGETAVSPLALLPLLLFVPMYLIPQLLRGAKLPSMTYPLLAFVTVTLVSSAASFALPLIPFKGQVHTDRALRGIITLGIGISFYLAALLTYRGEQRLRTSLRVLYGGLIILLIWSSIQAWLVLDASDRVPLFITRVHHLFSVRDPLGDRVTGMAFEPSWLGDQLMLLYLPLLIASVFRKYSVFTQAKIRLSVELLLMVWSIFILLLTQSRISLLSFAAVVSGIYFYLGVGLVMKVKASQKPDRVVRVTRFVGVLLLVLLWMFMIFLMGWVLSQVDDRLSDLLRAYRRLEEFAYFNPNEAGFALVDRLAFAERITYWTAGLRTFSRFPLLGVGPGNSGFFFEEHLPAFSYQLTEIKNVLNLASFGFPNPKNLWIRLLAEGGILGFANFLTWFMLTGIGAWMLWRRHRGHSAFIGLAGLIGAVAFIFEGFSMDTYALPQTWILFGLTAAVLHSSKGPAGEDSSA